MTQETSGDRKLGVPWWLIALVGACALLAVLVVALYFHKFRGALVADQGTWGQFGDYIGGTLNPLFGFSALLALLYTIQLQSQELRHSTEQLRKSAEALAAQNAVLQRQSFEATFFQLLRLYNELIQEFEFVTYESSMKGRVENTFKGREALGELFSYLSAYLARVARGDSIETERVALDQAYSEFYANHGHLVGHYFRTIYNVVKFVDRASLVDTDRRAYTNILRAQLSKFELALLFYNSLSNYGSEKMLPLVKKYHLLKHLEVGVLQSPGHMRYLER